MTLDILKTLKNASPNKRKKIVLENHKKNTIFLKKENQQLGEIVERLGTGKFDIIIDKEFLSIIDKTNGKPCHPAGNLYQYSKDLGSWHHDGWIDKVELLHKVIQNIEHGEKVLEFIQNTRKSLPEKLAKGIDMGMRSGFISLPRIANGRRFSGVTVFLGIFSGLHIAHYLTTTDVIDIVLLEPDIERFAISTYFLDYQLIQRRFKRLVLHVGPDMPENPPELLMDRANISSTAWLRFLPAYPSKAFDELIARFNLRWRAATEVFVPFDREVRNLCYGAYNIKNGFPILSSKPQLSANSRIVVVASGPSLDQDIEWLKNNKDKVIIFAAHSSMKALNKHGIRPDFQFSLDTETSHELWEKLEMQYDIPLVSYYKASSKSISVFNEVYLLTEFGKANPVIFEYVHTNTHPTTGNLATSLAVASSPSQLIFLGLDLGFRDAAKDHTGDYWAGRSLGNSEAILARANFSENEGQIYTYAYYNSARHSVEAALARLVPMNTTTIINFADGVRVAHATPCRSETYELTDYPEREADVAALKSAFSSSQQDTWHPYELAGQEIIKGIQDAIAKTMDLKQFDWMRFVYAVDSVPVAINHHLFSLTKRMGKEVDIRHEAFGKLIHDLLTEWYRMIMFAKTAKNAELVYKTGLESLLNVFENITWPAELDDWEGDINTTVDE